MKHGGRTGRSPESSGFNQKIWQRRLTDRRPIPATCTATRPPPEHVAIAARAGSSGAWLTTADSMAQPSFSELLMSTLSAPPTPGRLGGGVGWTRVPRLQRHEVRVRRAYHRGDVPFEVVRAELRLLPRARLRLGLRMGLIWRSLTQAVDRLYRGADGGLPDDLPFTCSTVGRSDSAGQRRQRSTGTLAACSTATGRLSNRHGRATLAEFPTSRGARFRD